MRIQLLLLLCLLLLVALPGSAEYLRRVPEDDDVHEELVRAINKARQRHGVTPVCSNRKLQRASQALAQELAHSDLHSSNMDEPGASSSSTSNLVARAQQQSFRFTELAEDVAVGFESVAQVVHAWLRAPAHSANLLGDYAFIGTGYAHHDGDSNRTERAVDSYGHYWTLLLATSSHELCDLTQQLPVLAVAA